MPVGAGSIRRVAKAAGTELAKDIVPVKEVVPVEKEAVEKKTVDKKSAEKKTMTKKTAKTATSAKKTVAKKTTSTKSTTIENATKEVNDVRESNQVCHITEELPIYLL